MRLFGFLALRTEADARSIQGIMGTTHIAFGLRCFFLGYGHLLNSFDRQNGQIWSHPPVKNRISGAAETTDRLSYFLF